MRFMEPALGIVDGSLNSARGAGTCQGLRGHPDGQWAPGRFDPSLSSVWGGGQAGAATGKRGHSAEALSQALPYSRGSRPPRRPRAITTPRPRGLPSGRAGTRAAVRAPVPAPPRADAPHGPPQRPRQQPLRARGRRVGMTRQKQQFQCAGPEGNDTQGFVMANLPEG